MFNSPKKSKLSFNPDKKIEEKLGQDFVTHNMPESHRFSGQTFTNPVDSKKATSTLAPNIESHHKIGFLIIGGGLILVAALFYFGYSYFIKPYLNQPETPVVSINKIVSEQIEATSSDLEKTGATDVVIETNEPTVATSTDQIASSTDSILPEERPIISSPKTVSTIDSDADNLTDDEEKIVGTDPNKADTDNDGYLDLAELKSGYDPLVPDKKISETSSILNYQIDSQTTVIYPANWEITKSEINNTVIFADSDKAFIQVVYENNLNKVSLQNWFNLQFPDLVPGEAVSGSVWQGFYSPDGLAAYIINKDSSKIYSFVCSPLTDSSTSITLFHLMIKTLLIK